MPVIKDIYSLDLTVARKVESFIQKCAEADVPVFIVETQRTRETQLLYALQGRFTVDDLKTNPDLFNEFNKIRQFYKFWALTEPEFNKKVTWTLDSKHFYGKAVDFCPMINGKLDWNAPLNYWQKCGEIAENLGFIWGGRWKKKDMPHIELP